MLKQSIVALGFSISFASASLGDITRRIYDDPCLDQVTINILTKTVTDAFNDTETTDPNVKYKVGFYMIDGSDGSIPAPVIIREYWKYAQKRGISPHCFAPFTSGRLSYYNPTVGNRWVLNNGAPNACGMRGHVSEVGGQDATAESTLTLDDVLLEEEYFNFAKRYITLYQKDYPEANKCIHQTIETQWKPAP